MRFFFGFLNIGNYFILSEEFRDYHIGLLENDDVDGKNVTQEDIRNAKAILEKAKKLNLMEEHTYQSFPMK